MGPWLASHGALGSQWMDQWRRLSSRHRKELLEKLFTHYDQLPEDIRLALPLKRVWMVAQQDE